jgi:hypothetical protein
MGMLETIAQLLGNRRGVRKTIRATLELRYVRLLTWDLQGQQMWLM